MTSESNDISPEPLFRIEAVGHFFGIVAGQGCIQIVQDGLSVRSRYVICHHNRVNSPGSDLWQRPVDISTEISLRGVLDARWECFNIGRHDSEGVEAQML